MNKDEQSFARRVAAVNPLSAPDPTGRSMRQRLAERPEGKSPATFKRYLKLIREKETLLALQKHPRQDNGSLSAFSPELLSEAIRLREEEPRRITSVILDHLKADPCFAEEAQTVALSTLARHLRQRGKTCRGHQEGNQGVSSIRAPLSGQPLAVRLYRRHLPGGSTEPRQATKNPDLHRGRRPFPPLRGRSRLLA